MWLTVIGHRRGVRGPAGSLRAQALRSSDDARVTVDTSKRCIFNRLLPMNGVARAGRTSPVDGVSNAEVQRD